MSWHEIKVEIPPAAADQVDGTLLELEIGNWSLIEDVIGRRAWIVGLFADEAEARARWSALCPLLPIGAASEPVLRVLADNEWRDSYKAHFHAWQFGRLHWVPVWERESFRLPPGDAVLWLDPGLAFGTGNHETTRLCIERLVALDAACRSSGLSKEKLEVVDAGCGSGILALSASLLGFERVAGFDNDPEAVRISLENAALNGLEGRVQFFDGSLETSLAGRQADVVLANIQADVLIREAGTFSGSVAPAGSLILGGILAAEGASVRAAYSAAAPGWPSDSRTLGEWCDLLVTRPAV